MRKHILIGITGGMGSGKSYVAKVMESCLSIPVYDCDSHAKRLCNEDEDVRRKLSDLVGVELYAGGMLVKTVLSRYLFSSRDNADKVEAIVHPAVRRDLERWTATRQETIVAVESAILYESGFNSLTDFVLYVDAGLETRIQRAMSRDGLTRRDVESRMALQQADEARGKADFIVDNNGTDRDRMEGVLRKIITFVESNIKNKQSC